MQHAELSRERKISRGRKIRERGPEKSGRRDDERMGGEEAFAQGAGVQISGGGQKSDGREPTRWP